MDGWSPDSELARLHPTRILESESYTWWFLPLRKINKGNSCVLQNKNNLKDENTRADMQITKRTLPLTFLFYF